MIFRGVDESDPARTRRRVFAAFWALATLATLYAFRSVLVPFVLAALLAFVLSPVVRWLTSRKVGARSIPRWAAVLGLYALMLTGLFVSLRTAVPALVSEAREFARDEVPRLRAQAQSEWVPRFRSWGERVGAVPRDEPASANPVGESAEDAVRVEPDPAGGYRVVLPPDGIAIDQEGARRYRVGGARRDEEGAGPHSAGASLLERARALGAGHTEDILRVGRNVVGGVIGGIFRFFITLMLSAYLLLTEARILAFFRSLVHPAQRNAFDELLHRLESGLSGVVRGQLIICAVNGVLSAVGFFLAKLPYWPLLALLAAIFSLVPIFGSILSSVPAVALGLRTGLGTGVFVLAWIVGIHQLEANVLNPKIMGDAAKIHPVLVVFSLLAGEHFFGILGALLAVPAMSIVQSVFLHWRKYALDYGDPVDPDEAVASPPPGG